MIYKTTEASKYLGISINSLKTLAKRERIKCYKTGNKSYQETKRKEYNMLGLIILLVIATIIGAVLTSSMNKKLKASEKFIYIVWCIGTLGMIWAIKILIKIAIMEALEADRC